MGTHDSPRFIDVLPVPNEIPMKIFLQNKNIQIIYTIEFLHESLLDLMTT